MDESESENCTPPTRNLPVNTPSTEELSGLCLVKREVSAMIFNPITPTVATCGITDIFSFNSYLRIDYMIHN